MTRPIAVIQIVTSSNPNSVAHVRTPRNRRDVMYIKQKTAFSAVFCTTNDVFIKNKKTTSSVFFLFHTIDDL